jgi:hypothetical protein
VARLMTASSGQEQGIERLLAPAWINDEQTLRSGLLGQTVTASPTGYLRLRRND